jgi:hypothetical protein
MQNRRFAGDLRIPHWRCATSRRGSRPCRIKLVGYFCFRCFRAAAKPALSWRRSTRSGSCKNTRARKDEADFIRNRWNEQTQLNLACINNDTALAAHEQIVYGEGATIDLDLARKYFVNFLMLNQIQHLFIAMNHRVLTRAEFDTYGLQILRLLKREEGTVNYLLDERGYSDAFKTAIRRLFANVTAPNFPPGRMG